MKLLPPTDAVILAGGFGTRLRSVVDKLPKPMAPVHGRPFLEYLMDYWIICGINRFVLSIGYLGECISSHFGSAYRNVPVQYVHENVPLGTGGGVRQALLQTEWMKSHAVILNGDTWYEVNLDKLVEDAQASGQPVTVALKPITHNDRYGGVSVDKSNNRIIAFGVERYERPLINGGCYLVDVKEVGNALSGYPDNFSLEQGFLVPSAREGKVAASVQDVTFLDIGIPEDYAKISNLVGGR